MRALIGLITVTLACTGATVAANAEPLKPVKEGPATQRGATEFIVHSAIVGRDFQVVVTPPPASPFLPGQKFPAVYALDAGYEIAGPQANLLGGTGAMAPAYIVSVGYRPGEYGQRNTDLLFNKTALDNGVTVGGGGAAFERFLMEELRPFIEARYPVDPHRAVLFGHSFGGLFAANVFAHTPDAFSAYVIGSASVWADPEVVGLVAATAAKAQQARIYLSVGSAEDSSSGTGRTRMADGYAALRTALSNRSGVFLKAQVYAGETHLSYYPRLVNDGFAFVLPPTRRLDAAQVKLPDETVRRYLGVYRMPDGREIKVSSGLYGLTGQVAGAPPAQLLQNGADRFYAPATDLDVKFDAAGATLAGGGGVVRLQKVSTP